VASPLEPSGPNAGYVSQLLEQYLDNPESVDPAWREVFERAGADARSALPGLDRLLAGGSPDGVKGEPEARAAVVPPPPPTLPGPAPPPAASAPETAAPPVAEATAVESLLPAVASAMALVDAIRTHGHLAARLDPLGSEPLGDPALDEAELDVLLTPEMQSRIPTSILGVHVEGETLAEALPRLRDVYMGTMAYEIEHISDHAERLWLRRAIESGRFRRPLEVHERQALLERLAQVEAFETYLRRAFIGQKQFSIEGLDALVPMLDEAIELGAAGGAHEILIGIAHRGRLNVLAHILEKPYAQILAEFKDPVLAERLRIDLGWMGDVKYHAGARTSSPRGQTFVTMPPNPSPCSAPSSSRSD